ncbi:MAG: UDP-N-acetylmuramoyl-L-alanine--D-glutamate ligase [Candidatus Limnocylindria bacterium]
MPTPPLSPTLPTRRSDLAGRRVLVLGLARSGVAAARFLADAGAEVTAYDRQSPAALTDAVAALGDRPVALSLGASPDAVRRLLADVALVVTSPSISTRFPTTEPWLRGALADAESRGVPVVSEVDLFLRLTRARVLAVTGTKGKTTTASLVAAMMAAADVPHVLGGNIGAPLIEEADRLESDTWAVLELSELQLPTLSRGADVAVYTNVLADHLDRHGSVEAYRAVKGILAELSADTGELVLNRDDTGSVELGTRLAGARVHWYSLDPRPGADAWVEDGWVVVGGQRVLQTIDVPLRGEHMLRNVLAAAVGARLAGAHDAGVADGVRGFQGIPHRLETIGLRSGAEYVNDSQATIPVAAIAGIMAFDEGRVVVIAGGQGKGLDYAALADTIAARCRAAVLIGDTAVELERLIGGRVPVRRAESMVDAVAAAAAEARPGDAVLLAPAAASFDMFTDYAARGDAFRTAVLALPDAQNKR